VTTPWKINSDIEERKINSKNALSHKVNNQCNGSHRESTWNTEQQKIL